MKILLVILFTCLALHSTCSQADFVSQEGFVNQAGPVSQADSVSQVGSVNQAGSVSQAGSFSQVGSVDQEGSVSQADSVSNGTMDGGFIYTEVEEMLMEARLEQLKKENANLKLKIQVRDKELENKLYLNKINEKLLQENIENMNENEQLRTENKMQAMNIEQLEKDLQSSQAQILVIQNKKDNLRTKVTATLRNIQNVTTQAEHLKSLLDTEQQMKLNHQEESRLERQMHRITKQELEDLKNLIKVPMNFIRILVAHISQLENMEKSVDMETTIRQLKEKEKLYMEENVAYQNEIEVLRNASYEENSQKANLITTIAQQVQIGELTERMINVLRSSLMEMTMTIPNCTTIETQALEAQLNAVLEKEDPMKQLISQCSIFNASATNLLNLHTQLNSQLKKQLATKLNVINHHIEENRELTNELEGTKQLANIQSESLKHLAAEMDSLIPNGITRVQRNDDGTIESVYLCQCIPEAPKASQLKVSAIEWTCADEKAIDNGLFSNNTQIENTVTRPCPGSDCSKEESSWPQCSDTLEKVWSAWEYLDCKELDVGNKTFPCGNGNRSRSREVRSSFFDPWRTEDVSEQCEQCSFSVANINITITPPALDSALRNYINMSNPTKVTLVGGSSPNEGNVFYNDQPVCDDKWPGNDGGYGDNNGKVVCRDLGYSGFVRFYTKSYFGKVPELFSMDDVQCNGTESRIEECPHVTSDDCGASEGAGVVCMD